LGLEARSFGLVVVGKLLKFPDAFIDYSLPNFITASLVAIVE
jgi:hypothetical protein